MWHPRPAPGPVLCPRIAASSAACLRRRDGRVKQALPRRRRRSERAAQREAWRAGAGHRVGVKELRGDRADRARFCSGQRRWGGVRSQSTHWGTRQRCAPGDGHLALVVTALQIHFLSRFLRLARRLLRPPPLPAPQIMRRNSSR